MELLRLYSTNNISTQIKIKGYKLLETVSTNNLTIKVYSDGVRVTYVVTGSTTIQSGILTNKVTYKPVFDITIELNVSKGNNGARIRIASDGGMQFEKNANTSDTCAAQSSATTFLATPLY